MIIHRILRYGLAGLLAVLPTALMRLPANACGHRIAKGARIGLSLVLADRIVMAPTARIGHLSVLRVRRVVMRDKARVGHLNMCKGPFSIQLMHRAAIGHRNTVTRAPRGVTYGPSRFYLGDLSKITASHSVDMTRSVRFGHFTTLAGKGSQIWSHGYVHDVQGEGRYRVDGPVMLGDNVYVGSGAIITGGVTLGDQVIVGAGVTVSKSLSQPGMYVSAPMRMINRPTSPQTRADMTQVAAPGLVETVYVKAHAPD